MKKERDLPLTMTTEEATKTSGQKTAQKLVPNSDFLLKIVAEFSYRSQYHTTIETHGRGENASESVVYLKADDLPRLPEESEHRLAIAALALRLAVAQHYEEEAKARAVPHYDGGTYPVAN